MSSPRKNSSMRRRNFTHSRLDLFRQGALPRKDLDQAAVGLAQAEPQYELARRHLDALNAVVHKEELKGLEGQLFVREREQRQGAAAQRSYSPGRSRSPLDGVVTDRPLYPGEMAAAGLPLLTVMDISRVTARAHIPQMIWPCLRLGTTPRSRFLAARKQLRAKS